MAPGARYAGIVLGESLRFDTLLEVDDLHVLRVWRAHVGDPGAGQPEAWTFLEFEVDESRATDLAARLASSLESTGGWYASFGSDDEMIVVFADRQFRYPRGDETARRDVEAYARSVGVPHNQLDWEAPVRHPAVG